MNLLRVSAIESRVASAAKASCLGLRWPAAAAIMCLFLAGCAARQVQDETPSVQPAAAAPDDRAWEGPPVPGAAPSRVDIEPDAEPVPDDPCDQFDGQYDSWLDRGQIGLYSTVCEAAAWFDGFFGEARYDTATGETYGRLSTGGFYDQRDGFQPRLRFRTRFAFPSLRQRGNFFLGRGNEDELIGNRGASDGEEDLPSITNGQDDSLFAGFGFNRFDGIERGLDFRVGAKLRAPPEPFVQASYRYGLRFSDRNLVRLRPLAYWRLEEKLGATMSVDSDNYIGENLLLRWSNFGNVSQDPNIDGLSWGTTLSLFQALSKRRALTYSLLSRGETLDPVRVKNYGYEMRYRQRVLRDWLFVEFSGSMTWPRDTLLEERTRNLGAGLRLEIYFGPAPESWVR